MADDDFPDWLPPAVHRATPDEQQQILLGIHGELERSGLLIGAEFQRRYPGAEEFVLAASQVDARLTECRLAMDRIEAEQIGKRSRRSVSMNRMIDDNPVYYDAPSKQHKLRVGGSNGATGLCYNGYKYSFNSILPPEFARNAANFAAMMKSGRIRWSTDNSPGPKPIKLEITPPKPNPKVEIITVSLDVVKNWKATFDHMVKLCDNNHAQAKDLLIANPDGNALYHKASVKYQRRQRAAGTPGGRVLHL
jgi:hypothetical protein